MRDGLDLKRMMVTVVLSLLGCVFMAMYNTGYQANLAISQGALPLANWQSNVFQEFGWTFTPDSLSACLAHGALYYLSLIHI